MTTQAKAKQTVTTLDEQQVVDYLNENRDFFVNNKTLLADMEIPHETGAAVSLVGRQVSLLRERNTQFESKLRDMVDAVHDNQRLNASLQRLAVNLFLVDGLDDIIATIDDEIRNKLEIEFFSLRLLTHDEKLAEKQSTRYIFMGDARLESFQKLITEKTIQCGGMTDEQAQLMFNSGFEQLASGAVVPMSDTETYGLLGLGSHDEQRYNPSMGTDYLMQLAALVSVAVKPYIK